MELIGKWKIKKILCITENGMDMIAPEELPETEDYDDYRIMCRAIFDFNADGMVYQLLTPEDFALRDTGEELRLHDGMAVAEEHPWKKEGDTYFCHTGVEGDIGGEEIDPYEALELDEDGCLPMMGGMMLLERI